MKTHTWESSCAEVVVEAFEVLNTVLESSRQQLCYYCTMEEPKEAAGGVSLIISAEQLEPFILGGSPIILVGTDTGFRCFVLFF